MNCIEDAVCTPQLQQELSQLSIQAFYKVYNDKEDNKPSDFWRLVSSIVEMLHKQVSQDYLYCNKTGTN